MVVRQKNVTVRRLSHRTGTATTGGGDVAGTADAVVGTAGCMVEVVGGVGEVVVDAVDVLTLCGGFVVSAPLAATRGRRLTVDEGAAVIPTMSAMHAPVTSRPCCFMPLPRRRTVGSAPRAGAAWIRPARASDTVAVSSSASTSAGGRFAPVAPVAAVQSWLLPDAELKWATPRGASPTSVVPVTNNVPTT
jgi:hypothetical protein